MNCDFKSFYRLEDPEHLFVKKCAQKYTQSFSFTYLLYRISNAVKHIFGKSDWQKSRLILAQSNPLRLSEKRNYNSAEFMLRYLASYGARQYISKNDLAMVNLIVSKYNNGEFPFNDILGMACYEKGGLSSSLNKKVLLADLKTEINSSKKSILKLRDCLEGLDQPLKMVKKDSIDRANQRIKEMEQFFQDYENSYKKGTETVQFNALVEVRKKHTAILLSIEVFQYIKN